MGRHGSYPQNQNQQQNMPAPANGALHNETTPLIGRTQNYENESRFKTFPKHVVHLTYATLASNYVNVLLVFVPLGIVAGAIGWNPTVVFILNFIAIIPLAALLSFATEELSAKLGQTLGGLMNATFGNAVELIVSFPLECADATTDSRRSQSLRSSRAKSALCNPACWAASCPISCL
jgi:Ca2+:H+ antiporter